MGAGGALAVSVLGVFAVPLALLLAVFLLVRHHADRSAFGILVGLGLLSLYVAHVQREGPGTVSWHTATASGSDTYMDPRALAGRRRPARRDRYRRIPLAQTPAAGARGESVVARDWLGVRRQRLERASGAVTGHCVAAALVGNTALHRNLAVVCTLC